MTNMRLIGAVFLLTFSLACIGSLASFVGLAETDRYKGPAVVRSATSVSADATDTTMSCQSYSSPVKITCPTLDSAGATTIALDSAGNVYIVATQQLVRINGSSLEASTLLTSDSLVTPDGVAVSPMHVDIYIADRASAIKNLPCQTRSDTSCVQYYSTALSYNMTFAPHRLAVDNDDNLYITDPAGRRVVKWDSTSGVVVAVLSAVDPVDITIDLNTFELLVLDQIANVILSLTCSVLSTTGRSCAVCVRPPYLPTGWLVGECLFRPVWRRMVAGCLCRSVVASSSCNTSPALYF
jgi:hypothetical protein